MLNRLNRKKRYVNRTLYQLYYRTNLGGKIKNKKLINFFSTKNHKKQMKNKKNFANNARITQKESVNLKTSKVRKFQKTITTITLIIKKLIHRRKQFF